MSDRSLGMEGSEIIDDTDLHSPVSGYLGWFCISVITDTVLTITAGTTASNIDNIAGLDTITLPAGSKHYGKFTAIKLASGVIQAYKLRAVS